MSTSPMLICKQCNYENEPERVYCHNCGAKLDRSLLPKEPSKTKEAIEQNRKRVKKLITPKSGFFTNWHTALINVLVSAVIIAALIQMARPPAGVPKKYSKDDLLGAPPLLDQIMGVEMMTTSQSLMLPQDSINVYLAAAFNTKTNTADDYFVLDGAFVNLGKDVMKITATESVFGYHIYLGADYKLAVNGGKFTATNVGGNIGRLPIHPMIMTYSDFAFADLWAKLQREKSVMDKMQSISIQPPHPAQPGQPGMFYFVTKPHP